MACEGFPEGVRLPPSGGAISPSPHTAGLAYALAATDIRVQAPIPGKTAVGVEVPNLEANYVSLGDVYQTFPPHASPLAFWLGKDVSGKPIVAALSMSGC